MQPGLGTVRREASVNMVHKIDERGGSFTPGNGTSWGSTGGRGGTIGAIAGVAIGENAPDKAPVSKTL